MSILIGGLFRVPTAGATKGVFAEFVVTPSSISKDGGHVVARIDSIYQIKAGKRVPVERIYVNCPSNDLTDWKVLFKPGDCVFELKREVKRERSRGWLFWGGKGETVNLKTPEKGWTMGCACQHKKDKKGVVLFGVFTVNGKTTRVLEIKGKDREWPGRAVPFTHGGKAEAAQKLHLSCGWAQPEENEESVALERTK